ncbi:MAG: diadenylate cyclase CdaA [Clostridiales bacterium]|nr:diadenylate cyclase CdaA [Clostridiales bacterium]
MSSFFYRISEIELPRITATDILEILIIAFALYHILIWVRNTRTWFLLKGVVVILLFFGFAAVLKLNTILFIAERSLSVIAIAILVVFQPELRKALEQLGKNNAIFNLFSGSQDGNENEFDQKTVEELVHASYALGRARTGALIVIEREIPLGEYVRTGIEVDALLTSSLLINIFEHNTPLHDGAVVVRGNRVEAATCYLPLSKNTNIPKELGTRHRAAIGVSEVSDSITIVVSEETGKVSVASDGVLSHNLEAEQLRELLETLRTPKEPKGLGLKFWKGRPKNERKDSE